MVDQSGEQNKDAGGSAENDAGPVPAQIEYERCDQGASDEADQVIADSGKSCQHRALVLIMRHQRQHCGVCDSVDGINDYGHEDVSGVSVYQFDTFRRASRYMHQQDDAQKEERPGENQPGPGLSDLCIGLVYNSSHDQVADSVKHPAYQKHRCD